MPWFLSDVCYNNGAKTFYSVSGFHFSQIYGNPFNQSPDAKQVSAEKEDHMELVLTQLSSGSMVSLLSILPSHTWGSCYYLIVSSMVGYPKAKNQNIKISDGQLFSEIIVVGINKQSRKLD